MKLSGVLFFPVTPFSPDGGSVDLMAFAAHVEQGLTAGPGGIFVACGTGELHALAPHEYAEVVRTAVEVTAGRVPVFAGAGGPLPIAKSLAEAAAAAGVDGLLVLPPYLVTSPKEGLIEYVRQVAGQSELPVIVYSRGNAVFDVAAARAVARIENVVGFKDGHGDLDLMYRIVHGVRAELADADKSFQFFNGLPTAEVTVPAYRGVGVDLYSSAVFCFAPEVANAFFEAIRTGDTDRADLLLHEFFHPLVALRDTVPGYSVSLVKAGVRLRGLEVGPVRAPLVDLPPQDLDELTRIIARGLEIAGADAGACVGAVA